MQSFNQLYCIRQIAVLYTGVYTASTLTIDHRTLASTLVIITYGRIRAPHHQFQYTVDDLALGRVSVIKELGVTVYISLQISSLILEWPCLSCVPKRILLLLGFLFRSTCGLYSTLFDNHYAGLLDNNYTKS